MKKRILLLSIITLFFSCNNQESEQYLSKIKTLEKELDYQQKEIDSLRKINLKTTEESIALTKKYTEGYVAKEYVSFFLKDEFKFATDKIQLVKFVFDHFNLNQWDIDKGIANSYIIENPNESKESLHKDITTKESLSAYVISKIDRSSESLAKIITPDVTNFITSLLQKNNLYKKAGLYTIVKALLYSYQEIENDDLSRIYEIASKNDYDETLDYISKIPSKKAKSILEDTENYTSYETWSDENSRTFLVYTFWARRYEEGNKKFVYDFLTSLHFTLTNEKIEV